MPFSTVQYVGRIDIDAAPGGIRVVRDRHVVYVQFSVRGRLSSPAGVTDDIVGDRRIQKCHPA
jgi:hypothetical protein